ISPDCPRHWRNVIRLFSKEIPHLRVLCRVIPCYPRISETYISLTARNCKTWRGQIGATQHRYLCPGNVLLGKLMSCLSLYNSYAEANSIEISDISNTRQFRVVPLNAGAVSQVRYWS